MAAVPWQLLLPTLEWIPGTAVVPARMHQNAFRMQRNAENISIQTVLVIYGAKDIEHLIGEVLVKYW